MVSDALLSRTPQTTPGQTCEGDSFQITLSDTNFLDSVLFQFPNQPSTTVKTQGLPHHIMFPQPGSYPYYAVAYSGCEEDTIYDTLTVHPQPDAHLGPDTLLCEGDTFNLAFQDTTFDYLWNTGDTTPGIEIFLPDTYSISVTSHYCGTDSDTVVIDSIIPALVNLHPDTLICLGDSLELDAEVALGSYQWNTGDTTAQFTVKEEGTYSVTATNLCRSDTDSTTVLYARPPEVELGNDTIFCIGDSVLLNAADTLSTYQWHDQSTDSAFTADSSGIYRVTVTNLCGSDTDMVQVRTADTPTVNIGRDTILCEHETYQLDATTQYTTNYQWNTGDTTPALLANREDTFSVIVDHLCGSYFDTARVAYDRTPQPDLGPDSRYCFDELVELDATWSRATYLWNTGQTDSIIQAAQEGKYWVEVTNLCGMDDDTVKIYFDIPLDFELGNDTTLCQGDSFSVRAHGIRADYLWNTGETDSVITINSGGLFSVQAQNACGTHRDSIEVRMLYPPQYEIESDDTLCEGDVFYTEIIRSNNSELTWFDGYDRSERTFTQEGSYGFELENMCGTKTDSVHLHYAHYPKVNLGKDTLLCSGEELVLQAPEDSNYVYEWNIGSDSTSTFLVTESGYYAVTVTNPPDCFSEDGITVEDCGIQLYIPNAFTPNGDGLNDVFSMESVELDEFWIRIFDRWGTQVFFSDDHDFKWYGTYRGEPVNPGVYTYKIWYRRGEYQSDEKHGTVTVLE